MADASELGLLQMGLSQVVKPRTREVIGYVYTTKDEGGKRLDDAGAQLQRWYLTSRTDNEFAIVPAPAEMAGWTLDQWTAHVRANWKPQAIFIWARARIYVYGGTYGEVTWTSLPEAGKVPYVQYPDIEGANFQIDVTGGKVLDIRQEAIQGLAVAFAGPKVSTSCEYWCTGPAFRPAGGDTSVEMTAGTRIAGDLKEFLRLAAPAWTRGSALSVVGCVTYQGDKPHDTL